MPGSGSQPPEPPETYPVRTLAGCEVLTLEGERLGVLADVLPSGGNDIFVVRRGERELLVPALKSVVRSIDVAARQIRVELPPGLRGIYEF